MRKAAVCLAAVTVALLAMGAGNAFGAQVKVCKQVNYGSIDALGSKTFTFQVTTNHPSYPGPWYVSIRPGECSLVSSGWWALNIPLILPNGSPTRITVSEVIGGTYVVQSIGVSGTRGTPSKSCWTDVIGRQTCSPTVSFDAGVYVNVVTFTNRYGSYTPLRGP